MYEGSCDPGYSSEDEDIDRAEDILKSAMIVIDTETGKYKKIDVLGA